MTKQECIALLERYANYEGMGIHNLVGCKEAMKMAAELLKQPSLPTIKGWVARDMSNHLRIYDNADCWGQGFRAFNLPVPFNSVRKEDEPKEVELIIRPL